MAKSRKGSRKGSRKFSMKARSGKLKHTAKSLAHATLVYAIKHKMSRKAGMKFRKSLLKNARAYASMPRAGDKSVKAHKKLVTRATLIAYRDGIKYGAFAKALNKSRKAYRKSRKHSRKHSRK
jgi:hypothetical protein